MQLQCTYTFTSYPHFIHPHPHPHPRQHPQSRAHSTEVSTPTPTFKHLRPAPGQGWPIISSFSDHVLRSLGPRRASSRSCRVLTGTSTSNRFSAMLPPGGDSRERAEYQRSVLTTRLLAERPGVLINACVRACVHAAVPSIHLPDPEQINST